MSEETNVVELEPELQKIVDGLDGLTLLQASLEVETPEQVAATIKGAMEFVDPERMLPCTNCGMAPLPRRIAEGKIVALGAGARLMRKELSGA